MILNTLKKHRKVRGWTQKTLAEKTGLGQSTISEIEKGTHIPSLEDAFLLAEIFGVPLEELFQHV